MCVSKSNIILRLWWGPTNMFLSTAVVMGALSHIKPGSPRNVHASHKQFTLYHITPLKCWTKHNLYHLTTFLDILQKVWAGIPLVQWLATGWTVRGAKPGGRRQDFPHPYRPALGPTQLPMGTGSFLGVKRLGHGINHPLQLIRHDLVPLSHPSSDEVMTMWVESTALASFLFSYVSGHNKHFSVVHISQHNPIRSITSW
jgi:hypothetical protein